MQFYYSYRDFRFYIRLCGVLDDANILFRLTALLCSSLSLLSYLHCNRGLAGKEVEDCLLRKVPLNSAIAAANIELFALATE